MVLNALQINNSTTFFSKEVGVYAKKRPFGRRKVNTQASAECKLSVDYITGHPVETSQCEYATFGFRSAPAKALTRWCISENKGFPN